jgi:hypothetical protein
MDAEKFLKDSNLTFVADGFTSGERVLFESDVIYLLNKFNVVSIKINIKNETRKREGVTHKGANYEPSEF